MKKVMLVLVSTFLGFILIGVFGFLGTSFGLSLVVIIFLSLLLRKKTKEFERFKYSEAVRTDCSELSVTLTVKCQAVSDKGDEYLIKKVLGFGAYGRVFEVTSKGKKLALKIFVPSSDLFRDRTKLIGDFCRRFENEKLLRNLSHPNIAEFDCFSKSTVIVYPNGRRKTFSVPFYTMNVYEESLDSLVKKEKRNRSLVQSMFESTVVRRQFFDYLIGAAEGIGHLHSDGVRILHRDIKPKNILIKSDLASISDFGTAFWHDFVKICGDNTITLQTNQALGSLDYMAPELGNNSLQTVRNSALDIYSFGITILFTMFFTTNLSEIKMKKTYLKDLGTHVAVVANAVLLLVDRMCSPDFKLRPDIYWVIDQLKHVRLVLEDEERVSELESVELDYKAVIIKERTSELEIFLLMGIVVLFFLMLMMLLRPIITIASMNSTNLPIDEKVENLKELIKHNESLSFLPDIIFRRFKEGNFKNADLTNIDLSHFGGKSVDFSGSNFSGSFIMSPDFTKSNFSNTNFSNTVVISGKMLSSNFSSAEFTNSTVVSVDFSGSNLENTSFLGSKLRKVNFTNCKNITFEQLSKASDIEDSIGLSESIAEKLKIKNK